MHSSFRSFVACALVGLFCCACSSDDSPPGSNGGASALGGGSGSPASAGNSASGSSAAGAGASGGAAGSASGAAGSASAGSAGAGGGSCGTGQYLICEDFDSTAVGQLPAGWTRKGAANLSSVADDASSSGSKSLKLGAAANGERRIARDAALLGAAHWGRIRFKVETVPDAFVHSTLVALQGVGPTLGASEYRVVDTVKAAAADGSWCAMANMPNCFQLLYNVQPEKAGEFGKPAAYAWPFDGKWHCAEWHIESALQKYELYYDDALVSEASFENGAGSYANSDIPSSFSELRIGWNNYQSAPPGFTAWIDDVALDEQRIGCQ
jgi:hypothetical protein